MLGCDWAAPGLAGFSRWSLAGCTLAWALDGEWMGIRVGGGTWMERVGQTSRLGQDLGPARRQDATRLARATDENMGPRQGEPVARQGRADSGPP